MHALAGAYVLDAVSDIERAAFSRHLADCETCALEVAELRETVARLADQTWSVPPPRMRAEVLAQIRRTPQLPPGGVARPAGRGGSARWRQWTIAAAAAGVVA
ncbi:anti-sigma factor, partial [Micromonospora echinofusca]|nr:anti-sigma factor [Micromonospora echinofusca]